MSSNNSAPKTLITALWSELVLVNFEIEPRHLQPLAPRGTEVDLYNEKAYVSVVAMTCSEISKFGLVLPIRPFNQIFLRFYVRRRVGDQYRTGTCVLRKYRSGRFGNFCMGRLLRDKGALLKIRSENTGFNETDPSAKPEANYRWRTGTHDSCIRVSARSQLRQQNRESKEQFIMDHRYRFFERGGATYESQITHAPWLLWDAASGNFDVDRAKFFGTELAKRLHKRPASVFLARGGKIVMHKPRPIS